MGNLFVTEAVKREILKVPDDDLVVVMLFEHIYQLINSMMMIFELTLIMFETIVLCLCTMLADFIFYIIEVDSKYHLGFFSFVLLFGLVNYLTDSHKAELMVVRDTINKSLNDHKLEKLTLGKELVTTKKELEATKKELEELYEIVDNFKNSNYGYYNLVPNNLCDSNKKIKKYLQNHNHMSLFNTRLYNHKKKFKQI